MNKHPGLSNLMAVLSSVGLVMAAYLLWARPYQQRIFRSGAKMGRVSPAPPLLLSHSVRDIAMMKIYINRTRPSNRQVKIASSIGLCVDHLILPLPSAV